jgi:hypothetical protein
LLLKAICKGQNKPLFSKDFIVENDLGTAGSVQKSIALLKKKILWMLMGERCDSMTFSSKNGSRKR